MPLQQSEWSLQEQIAKGLLVRFEYDTKEADCEALIVYVGDTKVAARELHITLAAGGSMAKIRILKPVEGVDEWTELYVYMPDCSGSFFKRQGVEDGE